MPSKMGLAATISIGALATMSLALVVTWLSDDPGTEGARGGEDSTAVDSKPSDGKLEAEPTERRASLPALPLDEDSGEDPSSIERRIDEVGAGRSALELIESLEKRVAILEEAAFASGMVAPGKLIMPSEYFPSMDLSARDEAFHELFRQVKGSSDARDFRLSGNSLPAYGLAEVDDVARRFGRPNDIESANGKVIWEFGDHQTARVAFSLAGRTLWLVSTIRPR